MNSDLSSFAALAPAYPELVLAVGAVVLLLGGVLFSRERSTALAFLSILLLVAVIAVAIWQPAEGILFNGGFIVDGFARYMKFLVLGGSAFTLILSTSTAKPFGLDKFEYAILVLLATLGMMVMVSANDLMSLYVGLELQSLALYVVAALKRRYLDLAKSFAQASTTGRINKKTPRRPCRMSRSFLPKCLPRSSDREHQSFAHLALRSWITKSSLPW